MLSDADTYKRLTSDPTTKMSEFLDLLLQEGIHLGIMNEKQRKYFLVSFPMCPALHAFPKMHKEVFPPPMHPIIAGVGSLAERACTWLDNLLQPLVQRVPGYIKDTKEKLKTF